MTFMNKWFDEEDHVTDKIGPQLWHIVEIAVGGEAVRGAAAG